MAYNRLDDRFVDSDILRGIMHRDVLDRAGSYHTDNISYTIKPDEVYRSDLASYRAYGTHELRWVIRLICGHEQEDDALPAGTTITLPDQAWLRDKVREYAVLSDEVATDG